MSTESLKHAKFDRDDGTSFDSPMAVVEDGFLDGHEKHSILGEWKRRVDAENRADGIDPMSQTLDHAIEKLAGLKT
ncbi:hypothetical protein [Aureimonas sp. Leaf324]|jgi:hypothetical protein|uniref:hypothetical protein n=1 Tax=Aureimonas sp. Leaf324 TaxID=1736336 RepID=UPI0006FEDDD0|nr:hypothetical protein [Aureimonas sp. Leaf324]KQQ81206.1 hypothetical protein ASF65_09365 [Aureimonas sp. Leaf324]